MSETSRIGEGAFPAVMPEEPVAPQWERIALDSRRPWSLDDRGRVLRIVTGHVDVFAVRSGAGAERPRHHLFRLESGEIVMDLPGTGGAIDAVGVIAVGGPGAEVLMVPRESIGERAADRSLDRPHQFSDGRDGCRLDCARSRGGIGVRTRSR